MKIAICYESVVPARGGCEMYIADLVRRLVADRHEVHLYGCERDAAALPAAVVFHALMPVSGPRFLRPWRFGRACEYALRHESHDAVIGFVKTWRQDLILPQGGLHAASADHNLRKYRSPLVRGLARLGKWLSLASWSYALLERRQYCGREQPLIIASSRMVLRHFQHYYGIGPERIRVIPNAIDPKRFAQRDRLKLRGELRASLGIAPEEPVALFVGHNYRLKGLDPLLHAVAELPSGPFRLLICGSRRSGGWRRLAKRLGVERRVHFLGYRADVHSCFFASDFLVHPTFYDPCSLVVLESLACGLPVVTSRYNGAAELLHPPHDGLVIGDPHDHKRLAKCLEHWCHPATRAAGAEAARKTAAAWTFEHHYRALLDTLHEVAARNQAA
jgi:UDP-glucose:(heptosyl)LPS alpha-1,3-glucosyltransferase